MPDSNQDDRPADEAPEEVTCSGTVRIRLPGVRRKSDPVD